MVHFTRDGFGASAEDNLKRILLGHVIEARTALGMASQHQQQLLAAGIDQRVVCFSETPIEYAWAMTSDIPGRQVSLSQFGIAVTKKLGRERGANPVWYLDQTPGHDWLTVPVNTLVAAGLPGGRQARSSAEIFRLTPFVEQFGPYKDFYWEREWRCRGDFHYRPRHLVAVFAPVASHEGLRAWWASKAPSRGLPLLDPCWGLERMIMVLSGVDDA